ncbi:MAG: redoxin domain-containing protein [Planctomycetes bacterium]|nr:redoxin domain-containing protein [Planctomycetota bacterium]
MGLIQTIFRRIFGQKPVLLAPGTIAPTFAVHDHTGVLRRLEDYRGRRVCLWFYPKASTPG